MTEIKYRDLHRVVGTVIIHRPDRTHLITKRSDKLPVLAGKWTVPGGGLEVDDYLNVPPTHKNGQWYGALELGLRREVREEVNLEVGKLDYLTNIAFIRPDGKPCLIFNFHAPYLSGEVKLSDEDVDFRWVRPAELGEYDLIDGIPEEIRQVEEVLSSRSVFS